MFVHSLEPSTLPILSDYGCIRIEGPVRVTYTPCNRWVPGCEGIQKIAPAVGTVMTAGCWLPSVLKMANYGQLKCVQGPVRTHTFLSLIYLFI